ncbi:Z1 domain-containing protein [Gammaproteobacteria bacterium]|nr:Z1 domain-containing protein [Gammaproteobacteria bacterium]
MTDFSITSVTNFIIDNLREAKGRGEPITREKIATIVDSVAAATSTELGPTERAKLLRDLYSNEQTSTDEIRVLEDTEDPNWEEWLPGRRGSVQTKFYSRYEQFLKRVENWADSNVEKLGQATETTLAALGDPQRTGEWDRRGLVVGLVQSGKTSHYVGLINKAVDHGYKIIIVLTGFTENLRVQGQERLEDGFLGTKASVRDPDVRIKSGVGLLGEVDQKCDFTTSQSSDFKAQNANNLGIRLQPDRPPILFVIKKNASILRNLLNWLHGNAEDTDARTNTKYIANVPTLIIDDESDVGSVDTAAGNIDHNEEVNEDHNPSTINRQIRQLLSIFSQSSYVGYTATPYANVLIHVDGRAGAYEIRRNGPEIIVGEDLFPRSFIHTVPTPSNHFGPNLVFGTTSRDEEKAEREGLPILRQNNDAQLSFTPRGDESSALEEWMPVKHQKDHVPRFNGNSEIPPSLREAIYVFILSCAAKRNRGFGNKHNSMLVHVTLFTDVQAKVKEQVNAELKRLRDRLINNCEPQPVLAEMKRIWETDFLPTTREINKRGDEDTPWLNNPLEEWESLLPHINPALGATEAKEINGSSADVLDYESRKETPWNVICIGGAKLSRGLTLKGLTVSYFLRNTKMYDTLMQMGRWFGYRDGYMDLCRLYTPSQMQTWFKDIADATSELLREFDCMVAEGKTPKEWGLKIESHPTLLVTSAVKMRNAFDMKLSFEGRDPQTVDFDRRNSEVENNYSAFTDLLHTLEQGPAEKIKTGPANRLHWRNVDADCILQFLEDYRTYHGAREVRSDRLKTYIELELQKGRLQSWQILVSGGAKSNGLVPQSVCKEDINYVDRSWKPKGQNPSERKKIEQLITKDHFQTGILISPQDERVDLEAGELTKALELTRIRWEKKDPKKRSEHPPKEPAAMDCRHIRDEKKGLLIIYPIKPGARKAESESTPIIGFGFSFPTVEGNKSTVDYKVNSVFERMDEEA